MSHYIDLSLDEGFNPFEETKDFDPYKENIPVLSKKDVEAIDNVFGYGRNIETFLK